MPDRLAGEDEDNDSARKDFLILMEVEYQTARHFFLAGTFYELM